MQHEDVTEVIVLQKMRKQLSWVRLAEVIGRGRKWSAAALLGQMALAKAQARAVGMVPDLPEEAVMLLQMTPYKGSLPTSVPTDPLVYRLYELISVYGTTFKVLAHEEFEDDVMSAISFNMDLTRKPDLKGDRVYIIINGEFLPYKTH